MLQLNKFSNFESQLPPRNVWYVWPRPSALHIYNILLLILRFDVLLASFEQDLYLSIFCILLFSWDHFHQPQNQSHDKYFLCWLKTTQKYCSHKTLIETNISFENDPRFRDGICHSRHSQRECKIFASGVNFSRNNAVCYINESKKLHYTLISSQKLLTYY